MTLAKSLLLGTAAGFAVVAGAQAADELRAAVKALHQAGIEVILDVVFNHTAEQDMPTGLMLCQRGIDAHAHLRGGQALCLQRERDVARDAGAQQRGALEHEGAARRRHPGP